MLAGAGITLGVGLGLASTAQAAPQTFTVGSSADTSGASDCATATNTDCTLRDAIIASNNNGNSADQDTIVFASSLTGSATTITLMANPPTIRQSLWIQGPGTAPGNSNITIDGDGSYRDFFAVPGGNYAMNLKVSGLTLTDGDAGAGPGGGISLFYAYPHTDYPEPTLTVQDSEVSDNTAGQGGGIGVIRGALTIQNSDISDNLLRDNSYTGGGGIYLFHGLGSATVTISGSTITGNSSPGTNARGGGVNVLNAPVTIQDSTISGNHTGGEYATGGGLYLAADTTIENSTISGNYTNGESANGGGLHLEPGRDLQVEESTIYGNSVYGSSASGGGIFVGANGGPSISDSTISGNYAYEQGGGIFADTTSPTMSLSNTLVADNSSYGDGPDLYTSGHTINAAFSLIESTNYATINETVAASNITGVDPQLGTLQDNGGPTYTQALPASSPAIDAGMSASVVDQRGLLRPVAQGSATSTAAGANCADIGAFELQVTGGGPGSTCHPSPPPPSGGGTNPTPIPTPVPKKKCKKKKHKSAAQIAKKKCKKKKK